MSTQHGAELVLDKITKTYGGRAAVEEMSLVVEPSEFVTILGPSGSGKTTVLRMIGGFVSPDSGRILIDGSDVAGVPVERRPTAMLFQQLSLWPHLSVARNVSFGLEIRHRPKSEIDQRVAELLEIVGLADFGSRPPGHLSGGEQQRVALARALALEPRILLLDEPFSALDTKLRTELRTFVRDLQREVGTTMLLVTHDQEEALELSDRIVVMHDGRVEQVGAPGEIYDAPGSAFVAEFLGTMNFVTGSMTADAVALSGGPVVHLEQPGAFGREVTRIGVRPEDVLVTATSGGGDFAVVTAISKGHYQQVTLQWHGGVLVSYLDKGSALRPGERVDVAFRRVHTFPDEWAPGQSALDDEGAVKRARAESADSSLQDPVLSQSLDASYGGTTR